MIRCEAVSRLGCRFFAMDIISFIIHEHECKILLVI